MNVTPNDLQLKLDELLKREFPCIYFFKCIAQSAESVFTNSST